MAIEVQRPRRHHRQRRQQRAHPEADGDRRDGRDAPVEQRDVEDADTGRDEEQGPPRQALPDVTEVLREADVPRRDFERAAQDELPDEEERHEPAVRLAAEGLAQVDERSARARHGGAELAPDHAVADDDHQRDNPAEHRLRTAKRRQQERDRDERTDPDHVDHVQGGRVNEAEARWIGSVGCSRLEAGA